MIYSLRKRLFLIFLYGWGIVAGLFWLPAFLAPRRWVQALLDRWVWVMLGGLKLIAGVDYEIRGKEHLPERGGLFASKHQSMFDVYGPWRFVNKPILVMKNALLLVPIFGWYSYKAGNIPVDRSGGAGALRKMQRKAKERMNSGHSLFIFPEGTRTAIGQDEPYKPGIYAIYKDSGRPCTPVALNSRPFWPTLKYKTRPGTIIVQILPPIEPGLDRKTFMARLRETINTASEELAIETGDL